VVRVQNICYLVGVLPQASSKPMVRGCTPVLFFAFPAWLLVYGRSRVDLPSLVVTALTFSNEISGCPRIFSKSFAGSVAAI
jgi:hypothetical protein